MSGAGWCVTKGMTVMDANRQTLDLPAGQEVTLNIGLGRGHNFDRLTVPNRIRIWAKALPTVMEPGYIAHMSLTPARVWTGEPLLVVQGTFKWDVDSHLGLWDAVVESAQDCIAVYDHAADQGMLFGPDVDRWGAFNINFFNFLGE